MKNGLRRVPVCEYVTGGALCNGPLPTDLMADAKALVGDLIAVPARCSGNRAL
ncbi:hypothetical protein [Azospirillum sp.]|uniref:hypothetical protein n=1 Tax=Azospirillum sp. TaxID=34012 RepID=UPI002D562D27|nr:hypothetical protein [Azospirillum sp.]HYF86603.1 hypothetical protein [Azospirillum sp.]